MRARLTGGLVKELEAKDRAFEVVDTEIAGLILRVEVSGVMTYYFRYRLPNGRRRIRLGPADRLTVTQARELARRQANEVAGGNDPQAEKKAARTGSLGAYLDGPYQSKIAHLKSRDTMTKTLKRDFAGFMSMPLSTITAWRLEKWRRARLEKGMAAASCNRPLSYLKALMNHARRAGIIKVNPVSEVKSLKEDNGRVRFLSPDERTRLYAALEAREDAARAARVRHNLWLKERGVDPLPGLEGRFCDHLPPLVTLALNTGLRRGELFQLQWADINMSTRLLTVRADAAKSGRARHIPLNESAMDALDKWQSQAGGSALVFPSKTGGVMDNVQTAWERLRKSAGLEDFNFHDMRHDFASRLVAGGVALNTVRELLGHRDFSTTLRYAHLAPGVTAAAVAILDNIAVGAVESTTSESKTA